MKLLTASLFAVCLSVCSAQNSATRQNSSSPSTATNPGKSHPWYQTDASTTTDVETTCYTIRAYFFTTPRSGAPKPAGTTTCVPSTQRDLKRAGRKPLPTPRLVY